MTIPADPIGAGADWTHACAGRPSTGVNTDSARAPRASNTNAARPAASQALRDVAMFSPFLRLDVTCHRGTCKSKSYVAAARVGLHPEIATRACRWTHSVRISVAPISVRLQGDFEGLAR